MKTTISTVKLSIAFIVGIIAGKLLLDYCDTRLMALSTSIFISIPLILCMYLLLSKDSADSRLDHIIIIASAFTGFASYVSGADRHFQVPEIFVNLNRLMSYAVDKSSLSEHGSFLKSIVLGGTEISPNVREIFGKTGIVHILSVSGLHVAYIALFIEIVIRVITRRSVIALPLQILGITAYALISGGSPPVLRAAAIAVFGLLARAVGRRSSLISAIAMSAIVVLVIDPQALFTISFQLSYITALSVLLLTSMVQSLLCCLLRGKSISFFNYVLNSIAVSISATIGSLPILAYYFGEVSVISPLANLVAVPISGLIVVLGLFQMLVYFLAPGIALALGAANGLLIDGLFWSANGLSQLTWAQAVVPSPSLPMLISVYSFIIWVIIEAKPGYFEVKRVRSIKRIVFGFVTLFAIILWGTLIPGNSGAAVSFINVGQGDSALIKSSDRCYMLVDAGPVGSRPWKPDAGTRYIVPFLHKKGITKLDALVLTHPDADHIGGAESLLAKVDIGRTYVSSLTADSDIFRSFIRAAKAKNVPVSVLSKGDRLRLGNDVIVDVINPPADSGSSYFISDNDRSVVLMISRYKKKLLLAADIEAEVEQALIDDGVDLDCDILKVSHHGSKTSTTQRFLDASTPGTAVISVGRNNYGHPSSEVLNRLKRNGVKIWRTDIGGDATIPLN